MFRVLLEAHHRDEAQSYHDPQHGQPNPTLRQLICIGFSKKFICFDTLNCHDDVNKYQAYTRVDLRVAQGGRHQMDRGYLLDLAWRLRFANGYH